MSTLVIRWLEYCNHILLFISQVGGKLVKMSVDIVLDKIHSRHDPKWSGRLGPAEGGGLLVCVACVIEMIESDEVSVKHVN